MPIPSKKQLEATYAFIERDVANLKAKFRVEINDGSFNVPHELSRKIKVLVLAELEIELDSIKQQIESL